MKRLSISIALVISAFNVFYAQKYNKTNELKEEKNIQYLHEQEMILKKEALFVDQLKSNPVTNTYLSKSVALPPNPSCTNMDFETGNASGWAIDYGQTTLTSNNSCLLTGCCSGTNTTYTVLSNGYIDSYIPTMPINSQYGAISNGSKFIKINNEIASGKQQKLSQTFSVTPANSLFQFAYKFVAYSGGHICCQEAFMNVRFRDQLGNIVPFTLPNFSVTPSSVCNTYTATSSGMTSSTVNAWVNYTPWIFGLADLSSYVGKSVTFEMIVGDCANMGHFAYAYFDAMCSGISYSVNSNSMQLDSTNNTCVTSFPATLSAPNGFQNYVWSTGTGTVSGQNFNVTTPGTYTLAITAPGACCPTYKVFNVSVCTGITNAGTKSVGLFLYPNPTKTEINFVNVPSNAEFMVYDLLGNTIRNRESISENKKADISELSVGIYFIKVYSDANYMKTFKIVKE